MGDVGEKEHRVLPHFSAQSCGFLPQSKGKWQVCKGSGVIRFAFGKKISFKFTSESRSPCMWRDSLPGHLGAGLGVVLGERCGSLDQGSDEEVEKVP